jgi:hypothetical protein
MGGNIAAAVAAEAAAAASATAAAIAVASAASSVNCVEVSLFEPQHLLLLEPIRNERQPVELRWAPFASGLPECATAVRCELLFRASAVWTRALQPRNPDQRALICCSVTTFANGVDHAVHTHAISSSGDDDDAEDDVRAQFWLPVGPSERERKLRVFFRAKTTTTTSSASSSASASSSSSSSLSSSSTGSGVDLPVEGECTLLVNAYRTPATGLAGAGSAAQQLQQLQAVKREPAVPSWATYDHSKSETDNFSAMATRFATGGRS